MSIFEIVFSPTGGTEKVSKAIVNEFKESSIKIDIMKTDVDDGLSFKEDDICFVSVPSYGGRVPSIVSSRLSQMHGENAMAVPIAVYGNRAYDDTLLELEDILTKRGFRCIACVAAIAQHSVMGEFAKGRPDARDLEELKEFAEKVKLKCQNHKAYDTFIVPGNRPYREYKGLPIKPKANRRCNQCGLCAAQCPLNAIHKDHPSKSDYDKCITCMHCVAICPSHARSVNQLLISVAAWKMKKACADRKANELFI